MKKLIAVFCLLFLSLNTAYAVLVEGVVFIDNLTKNTVGESPIFNPGKVFISEETTPLDESSDFSSTRIIDVLSSSDLGTAAAKVIDGELQTIADPGASGDFTFTYANATGFDLTLGRAYEPKFEGFVIGLKSIDQGGVDIGLTIDGKTVSQFVNTVGLALFSKKDFVDQGVDLSSVHEIIIDIHNNLEVDATFEFFEYGFIPEPATLALFGAGLFGVGFVRRKKFNL